MDENERALLQETAELTQENNKLLKKLHRQTIFATIVRIVRWVLFVVFAIWSYVLIQPFIEQAKGVIQSMQETQQSMNEMRAKAQGVLQVPDVDFSGLQNMLDAFTINGQ
jgi:flagellar biosynthesis/type III secretory pathway M-ring protein FliF/YscJ